MLYKHIQKEHNELRDALVENLETLAEATKRERYEATSAAIHELARAMQGQYHRDAWAEVENEFDFVLGAADCGHVWSSLYWVTIDEEDGEELDRGDALSWSGADLADVWVEGANWTHPSCTKFKTFASEVVACIMSCFGKHEGTYPFFAEDIETDVEEDAQIFTVRRGEWI